MPTLRTPEWKSQNPSSKIKLPTYTRLSVIPSASEGSPEISLITHRNLCDQSTTVRSLTSFGMTELHEALSPILPFIFGLLCLILRLPMSSKTKPPATELNFEKAMDRLEAIVEQMETGKLPLEDLIVRYEEGMNLVKVCQERLTNAEEKIEIIARNNAGKPTFKNFEPVGESSNDNNADQKELKNDEVRLF